MNTLLEAALSYASKGWHVFPLKGKIPLTPDGFKSATVNEALIRKWWELWPNANIGIATGAASDLVVIDIDKKSGGWTSVAELNNEGHFFSTEYEVETGGGGAHFYYEHPGHPIKNKAGLFPGIDVRGDGGYVVAPPSTHESGKPYVSLNPAHRPNLLPEWLLDKLKEAPKAPPSNADGEVIEGGRNQWLTATAGFLQRKGVLTLEGLLAINDEKCSPPLPEREVTRIFENVSRYEVSDPVVANADGEHGGAASLVVRAADLGKDMVTWLGDKAKVKGVPTGLAALDKMLGGGRRTGEVTCWHAEAKTGKNTLWHFLQFLWLEAGMPIAYASRELTPETEVLPNLLSIKFGENAWLAELTDKRSANYTGALNTWPLYFARGYGYFSMTDIKRWVNECHAAGVSHFFFDHLHYMLEDPEDHKAASKLIKELKTLAKEKDIHIDIIIQPNKLADGQRLSLNSIKGGAAMGQAIDNLLVLERVKGDGIKNICKLTLEVARSKLCKPGHMYLQFDPDTTMFQEAEAKDIETTQSSGPTPYVSGRQAQDSGAAPGRWPRII
jgi:hypothetical protein